MIYKRQITDVKGSGFDGKCKRCPRKQKGLIRVTFNLPDTSLSLSEQDRYLCDKCWLKLSKNKKFNVFNQEVS